MGQGGEVLRFELPVTAAVANLTGPATGVHRLVGRPPTEFTATVIDTADHRLLDWGLELSRVAETGRWALRAPGWEPVLAAERISPQAEDEIPPDMAEPLVPFRRGGILGPKLEVVTMRRRFSLTDAGGRGIGELSDERVRVSRPAGLLTTYRTVTLSAGMPLPPVARDAFAAAFASAGGTPVDDFPGLAARLGMAHHSQRRNRLSARAPIEDFVSAQFESRWRSLLRVDLAARAGDGRDAELRVGVRMLREELAGLAPLLDAAWVESGERLLDAALVDTARPMQHTERWLRILDLLAQGSTEPPLPQVAGRITGPVLAQELEAVVQTLCDQCRTLDVFSLDARWARAREVAVRARTLSALARDVFGKPAKQLRKQLQAIVGPLGATVRPGASGLARDLHDLTTAEVFEAGRAYERAMLSVDYAREQFLRDWPGLWDGLRARAIRPRVPHEAVPIAAAEPRPVGTEALPS